MTANGIRFGPTQTAEVTTLNGPSNPEEIATKTTTLDEGEVWYIEEYRVDGMFTIDGGYKGNMGVDITVREQDFNYPVETQEKIQNADGKSGTYEQSGLSGTWGIYITGPCELEVSLLLTSNTYGDTAYAKEAKATVVGRRIV